VIINDDQQDATILDFGILLTVHLSIISVNVLLDAKILCSTIIWLQSLTCLEHCHAHHQEFSLNLCTGRTLTKSDDTRCCIFKILPPDDEHNVA
jgi:hypothetical protein